ncbi:hypothetical protein FOZ62_019211, partial [Perkinsus olseni]
RRVPVRYLVVLYNGKNDEVSVAVMCVGVEVVNERSGSGSSCYACPMAEVPSLPLRPSMCHTVEGWRKLDKDRVMGAMVGTIPSDAQQNSKLGLPMLYLDTTKAATGPLHRRDVVARHLAGRGLWVGVQPNYGCDLVVYLKDPRKCHSDWLVHVVEA